MTWAGTLNRPAPDEFAPPFAAYIATIPQGTDPRDVLLRQLDSIPPRLAAMPEARGAYRYAPDKWSIKQVIGHVSDTERVFAYRLLRIARGDETPLAGFDENVFARTAGCDARSLVDLVGEFMAVRQGTLALVRTLDEAAWARSGVADGHAISARALAFLLPGHVQHHVGVLRKRYGLTELP